MGFGRYVYLLRVFKIWFSSKSDLKYYIFRLHTQDIQNKCSIFFCIQMKALLIKIGQYLRARLYILFIIISFMEAGKYSTQSEDVSQKERREKLRRECLKWNGRLLPANSREILFLRIKAISFVTCISVLNSFSVRFVLPRQLPVLTTWNKEYLYLFYRKKYYYE